MTNQLASLFGRLEKDIWRTKVGFSPEIQEPLEDMLADGLSDGDVAQILAGWLGSHQPCLFGRIAAKRDLIEYCVLREEDIFHSDERVKSKIAESRLRCIARSWSGQVSAFVIVLLSRRLSEATPDQTVEEIARRLLFLYLGRQIELDTIYLEELFLEVPNRQRNAWKWDAGINYFSSQADKRWWQDHRMPVSLAFSVNSVGHMVKSRELSHALNGLNELLGLSAEEPLAHNIDSLGDALAFAMRTIDQASEGPSGKATMLLPQNEREDLPRCPIPLSGPLANKDHCEYRGLYHTDITLPHEYFMPDVQRPSSLPTHQLDFTYLFDDSIENPDHTPMGKGHQIREHDVMESAPEKSRRSIEVEIPIENAPLLLKALGM